MSLQAKPELTVITEFVPESTQKIIFYLKKAIKKILNIPIPYYTGHQAVTRSLVEGLQKNQVHFNYNPKDIKQISDVVAVLSSVEALQQMINLKKRGIVKRILAGPNLVILPSDHREVMIADEIDICIVNSDWVHTMYVSDVSELTGRCIVWPAGVDTEYWSPLQEKNENKQILFYQKNYSDELLERCKQYLRNRGFTIVEIIYGEYKASEYLQKLRTSDLAVFFSPWESQGIALAEAWASDIPTFVWNPGFAVTYQGTADAKRWKASSAPYLCEQLGLYFLGFDEFKIAFEQWQNASDIFSPRNWVINNMSDEICAKAFCRIAGVAIH